MKSKYFEPLVEIVLLDVADVLTFSSGEDHGGNVPTAPDEDWDLGYTVVN